MTRSSRWLGLALVAGLIAVVPAEAQPRQELTARVWLDRGEEPVLRTGERVRLYYRTSDDAWVAIFHVDTNGTTRLVFPRSPDETHYAAGARDYRLLFPESSWWYVDDDPGIGYFFIVASPEPFDFTDFRFSHWDGGWDLSYAGRQVYSDPYVAMDDYVARLIPDWEYVPYALDFLSYHVDQRYEYPRFLCYDCHGFRPYAAWNPYYFTCTSFRVVIYDDPYYYPATRYRGDRVVFVRPATVGVPRFTFKERARGELGTPMVASRPEGAPSPGQVGGPARRSTAGIGSGGRPAGAPNAVPLIPGRPTDAIPGRAGPSTGRSGTARPLPGATPRRGDEGTRRALPPVLDPDSRTGTRPVLTRRPPTRGGGGGNPPARPPARPSTPTRGGGSAGPAVPTRPPTGGARPTPTRRPTPPPATPTRRGGGGGGAPPPATPTRRGGGGSAGPAVPTRPPTRGARPTPTRRPTPPPATPTRRGGGGG